MNRASVAIHLSVLQQQLDSAEELLEVAAIGDSGRRGVSVVRRQDDTGEIAEVIERSIRAGDNLYVGVLPRTRVEADYNSIPRLSAVWLDLDDAGAAVAVLAAIDARTLPEPNLIVQTGTRPHLRLQVTWLLAPPYPGLVVWQRLINGLILAWHADKATKDPPRILRLAGSDNNPTAKKRERGYIDEPVVLMSSDLQARHAFKVFEPWMAEERIETASTDDDMPPHRISTLRYLSGLLPNRSADWDRYIRLGLAYFRASEGNDWGYEAWKTWCRRCPDYHEQETKDRWGTFRDRTDAPKVTMGTLRHEIKTRRLAPDLDLVPPIPAGKERDWLEGVVPVLIDAGHKHRAIHKALVEKLGKTFIDDIEVKLFGQSGLPDESETQMAKKWSDESGEDWRWIDVWGKWYAWNGKIWEKDETLTHVRGVGELVERVALSVPDVKTRVKLLKASTTFAVDRLTRGFRTASVSQWDQDKFLINTPHATYNLATNDEYPHVREDYVTRMTAAIPKGDCPLWRQFLDRVTGSDSELQLYLQRVAGYCATGDISEQALFFLYGVGANGKTTFMEVLRQVLGPYATVTPMETLVDSHNDRHPAEIARLRGARLVIASEVNQGQRWNESRIKTLTGDGTLTARFMNQDFFEFVPTFKLMIAGNYKPSFRGINEAITRRFHLVPFTVTIPSEERDTELLDKLLVERDGILQWMIDGAVEWRERGLVRPTAVQEASRDYIADQDMAQQFISEKLVLHPGDGNKRIKANGLYEAWKQYAGSNGLHVGSIVSFAQMMDQHGMRRHRLMDGMYYIGVEYANVAQRDSVPVHDEDPLG